MMFDMITKEKERVVFANALFFMYFLSLLLFVGNGLHNLGFQFFAQFGIVGQQLLGGVATLTQFVVLVREPGTTFLDDAIVNAEIDNLANL